MIAFSREVQCFYVLPTDIFAMNADGTSERRVATAWRATIRCVSGVVTQRAHDLLHAAVLLLLLLLLRSAVWVADMQGVQHARLLTEGRMPAWKP